MTIPAGYVVDLDYENPGAPLYNTIYGPEWGFTVNNYGTLEYGWMMAAVQNDPTPGNRSIINLYNGSTLACNGAGIGIGDAWWWYQGGPFMTVNMYGNAQMQVANVGLGGHLNIYDTAIVNVTNAGANVFTGGGVAYGHLVACSDGTASLVIGGGTLVLRTGYTNEVSQAGNTVYDLIARGVIRAYGKGYDTNDLVITDNGTNTIVTTVPLGGSLSQIYFQPLPKCTMTLGMFEQATLVGDYPPVTGVLLSSIEPGVNPATFTHPVYTSSKTNVVTVDTNGIVTAVGYGTATLTAKVGALNSINSLTVTVTDPPASLIHRYSFTADASDSVGSSAWNGTLNGVGTVINGGQVVLTGATNNPILGDGVASYVQLPAGILSGLDEVTIEAWASFNVTTTNNFENLFAFGNSDVDILSSFYGDGSDYILCQPHTGAGTTTLSFGQGVPGNAGNRDAGFGNVLDGQNAMQVVAVFHPYAGYQAIYTNGVLAATVSMFNDMIDPVAYMGPTFTNGSILSYILGADPVNYIGASLYGPDPGLKGSIDEFRIYNGPLSAAEVAADHALGPNQLRGTSMNVSLSVKIAGDPNVVISWPTTSALVTLMSSPVLGPGAVWTPVNTSSLVVVGGNYQITIPATGTAFYRLVL